MSPVARFGLFEADLEEGALRKNGRIIKLQHQPFEVLRVLVEHPNQVVSRDELRARLWPSDIVVDFDQSLNKSIAKLRDALGDSATSPRFIETVLKRGYRFIAPVAISCANDIVPAPVPATAMPRDVHELPLAPAVFAPGMLVPAGVLAGLVAALLWFTGNPPRRIEPGAPAATIPDAALELYSRGRIALLRRSEEGLRNAVDLFGRAINLAPAYDAAYVGVADGWSLLASYGMEEPRTATARARDYARRALAINPRSGEAHASLGRTSMLADWDWTVSESYFKKAIALEPGYAPAHQWYAYLLSAMGRHAEAEQAAMRAAASDRLSLNAATSVGYVQYAARDFDKAASTLRRVLEVDPDFVQARRNLGLVLTMQGKHAEAVTECERVLRLTGDAPASLADLAWARGKAGDRDVARRILRELEARSVKQYVPGDVLAKALLGAGYNERAIDALAQAFESHAATLTSLAVDPVWDELRESPKVKGLTMRVQRGPVIGRRNLG
jgi:DNA-binding winged helix-turn-helix (wHTH) protein/Tfp pilus assembly protein PilF